MKKVTRIVRGLRLVSTVPGYESDPSVLFQFLGKARLGPSGARYSLDRWLSPTGEVASSLDSAVKRYLTKIEPTSRTA